MNKSPLLLGGFIISLRKGWPGSLWSPFAMLQTLRENCVGKVGGAVPCPLARPLGLEDLAGCCRAVSLGVGRWTGGGGQRK